MGKFRDFGNILICKETSTSCKRAANDLLEGLNLKLEKLSKICFSNTPVLYLIFHLPHSICLLLNERRRQF